MNRHSQLQHDHHTKFRTGGPLLRDALAIIDSTLHGGVEPTQRQFDRLRGASPTNRDGYHPGHRALILAARAVSLARADQNEEATVAVELVGAIAIHGADLEVHERLACFGAAAEVYLMTGDAANALQWALRLALEAQESLDTRWHYRSQAALALAYALSGADEDAEVCITRTIKIKQNAISPVLHDDPFDLGAQAIIAFSQLDEDRATDLAARGRAAARERTSMGVLADLLESLELLLKGDIYHAGAHASRVAQGLSHPRGSTYVRQLGVLVGAVISLFDREPLKALNQIESIVASSNHDICPGGLRAAAYVQIGDYRSALLATSECARRSVRHNLWTIPLVMLSRAIAYEHLGQPTLAVRRTREALAHTRKHNLAAAITMMPSNDIEKIRLLVASEIPAIDEEIKEYQAIFLKLLPQHRESTTHSTLPKLSSRERVVAMELRTDHSIQKIADRLHVSPGTVKSQASSIYKKLGVRGRQDAVTHLETIGYYH